ncbi:MAG: PTS sugar transporter subunit IIA, partial [Candidatus Marinimicrobia bacterium]|nr:PTS sugar transporter subunit IIA [Candidatus Neomarinimicrobiota bacterium]
MNLELSTILTPDLILYPVKAATKEEAISQLVNVLVKNGKLTETEEAKSTVYKREELMTTGVGKGVALPHGK